MLHRRQLGQHSCGAAALTVALAELMAEPNSDETEERIWRWVRGNDDTWSVPGKLAITAWREYGIIAQIWQDDGRLQNVRSILPAERVAFDVGSHIREHEAALAEAERNGVAVTRGMHNVDTLAALMDQGWRLVLVTVVPAGARVNLHYMLGRSRQVGGGYALMDPAEDRNRGYLLRELDNFLYGPAEELGGLQRYLGIAVGVLDFLVSLNQRQR